MTQQQIALLELALVGGLGAVLFIAGILIKVFFVFCPRWVSSVHIENGRESGPALIYG